MQLIAMCHSTEAVVWGIFGVLREVKNEKRSVLGLLLTNAVGCTVTAVCVCLCLAWQ